MLKKISVDDLRPGMFLHGLVGNWLDHPFWKTKFLLDSPRDLALLRESAVRECWIDLSRGVDVAAPPPVVAAVSAPQVDIAVPPRESQPVGAVSLADEVGRASVLISQSRAVVMALHHEARMGSALDAEGCLPLVADITASVWRNPGALVSLSRLKTHDDYSYMHSVAVCALMVALARQLGQSEAEARDAGLAGLLHDMGKAVMPAEILKKPGKLTDAEYELIKSHPQRGHDMLKDGSAPPIALDVCLHHHERPDGAGYPFGLKGDQVSKAARMGAICDVYDAITSNRPYKAGWDPADSVARMTAWGASGQFDPDLLAAFVKSLGVYPVGSLVRMRSTRLAVVVEQGSSLLKPWVKVFFSTKGNAPLPIELMDTSDARCTDQIAARESNATWKFPFLDELWAGRVNLATAATA